MNNPNVVSSFYIGAVMRYDLDSEDVDLILSAAKLSVDDALSDCVTAVRAYVNEHTSWVPGGPITDMGPALAARFPIQEVKDETR